MAGLIRRKNDGKSLGRKMMSMALALAVGFTMMFAGSGIAEAKSVSASDIKSAFEKTGDYLYSTVTDPVVGSTGGEWVIYGLGNAGYDMSDSYVQKYKTNLVNTLKEGYRGTSGILHDKKFTEYARAIIACTYGGLNATDIDGYDLTAALADFVNVKWQGMNGPIWALIALDAGGYDVPKLTNAYYDTYGKLADSELAEGQTEKSRQNSRARMVNYILANQISDGGWSLQTKAEVEGASGYSGSSDVDMTGMALTALAPYLSTTKAKAVGVSQTKVKTAVNKAITFLSKAQKSDGGFTSWGTSNSESCAQAICGLVLCGVNPDTDSRFIKNGNSVIDALMSFYTEETDANGNTAYGFKHVNTASGGYQPVYNQMATEQAYYALAIYYKCAPSKVTLTKAAKAAKGKIKVTYKKASVNTTYTQKKAGKTATVGGYQIYLSTSKNFTTKTTKKVTVSGASSLSKNVTGLKAGKTYYVKVRSYKTVNGQKVYGAFSTTKKATC